ncbi:hypothetical protein PAHAL_4G322000 [Panicum hallii]|uniref:Uncharacterized protein n=1 Tax=Panicum hallii TaxID=206008 RepID=A0A2T8JEP5_9POAL|nr:hypothetical protein PAHAL_4G322000 [Panicum hallii]
MSGESSSPAGNQRESERSISQLTRSSKSMYLHFFDADSYETSSRSSSSWLHPIVPLATLSGCSTSFQTQLISRLSMRSRIGLRAVRHAAVSRSRQCKILTSLIVGRSAVASLLIPDDVTRSQPWMANLASLPHPRPIAARLASVRSRQLLMQSDSSEPHTATPSRCNHDALHKPWKPPRVKNLIRGHLRASASIAGAASSTLCRRSSVKSSSAGSAAKKETNPATVMAASSRWLVDADSNGSRSCKTVSLGHLVAMARSASSPTKSTYRGLNTQGATSFRRLGQDPAMAPSSVAWNPSVAPARPRSSSVSAAAAAGCAASAGPMSSVQQ